MHDLAYALAPETEERINFLFLEIFRKTGYRLALVVEPLVAAEGRTPAATEGRHPLPAPRRAAARQAGVRPIDARTADAVASIDLSERRASVWLAERLRQCFTGQELEEICRGSCQRALVRQRHDEAAWSLSSSIGQRVASFARVRLREWPAAELGQSRPGPPSAGWLFVFLFFVGVALFVAAAETVDLLRQVGGKWDSALVLSAMRSGGSRPLWLAWAVGTLLATGVILGFARHLWAPVLLPLVLLGFAAWLVRRGIPAATETKEDLRWLGWVRSEKNDSLSH